MRSFKGFLFLSFLLFTTGVHAVQALLAREGEVISAELSQKELSRISIEGDKITQYQTLGGRFLIQKDEQHGVLYLKPGPLFEEGASIYVSTLGGKTYILSLKSRKTEPQNIVLKTGTFHHEQSFNTEDPSIRIVSLIKSMMQEERMAGAPKGTPVHLKHDGLEVRLRSYQCFNGLCGAVYTLKNKTKGSLFLEESALVQGGVRAVALEASFLEPRAVAKAFVIVEG